MREIIGSDFFAGNRARLRELFTGTAPIIITANGLLQRSGDNTFDFHQDANFWYLTGINEPDLVLVMDKDKEYLILPERSEVQDIFDGSIDNSELIETSGIVTVLDSKEGWRLLGSRLKRVKHAATLAANPAYIEVVGMYTNPARNQLIKQIKKQNPDLELLDLREHLSRLRVIKQPVEIAAIQKAVDITIKGIQRTYKREYGYEYELEAALTAHFRKAGASGHAYNPIVASGKNSLVLHYMANNMPIETDSVVLIDVGAQYQHYAADISRTWVQGKTSPRQKAVIAAVNEVLEFGLEHLKPGVLSFADCETKVRQFMGEKLRSLGLIKTIDAESIHKYYPHSPHYLGLDVHDVGDYHQILEPGMVMTIEPGIYIPEENIGVRIEEDILITDTGYEVLSAKLPRVLE